jgi:hypothetical protein
MVTKEEKKEIQEGILNKTNKLLEEKGEPYRMDTVSILNTKDTVGFMGSIRVHDPEKLKEIKKGFTDIISSYGEATIQERHVIPCCELPYDYISFNMKKAKTE